MSDLEHRFRWLRESTPPDLWEEIHARVMRDPRPAQRDGRVLVAAVALLLAGASIGLLMWVFQGQEALRQVPADGEGSISPGPSPSEEAIPEGWELYRDTERGITALVPQDWIVTPPEQSSVSPTLLAVGTGTVLSGNCEQMLANVDRDGALVFVFGDGAGRFSWPPRAPDYGPGVGEGSDFEGCVEESYAVSLLSFIDQGRAPYVLVVVGPEANEATEQSAWGVVNSLELDPGELVGPTIIPADGWDTRVSLAPGDYPPVAWTSNERLSLDDTMDDLPLRSINGLTSQGVLLYVSMPYAKAPGDAPEDVPELPEPITLDVLEEQLSAAGIDPHIAEFARVGIVEGNAVEVRLFLGGSPAELEATANEALARIQVP
jgi:hypothetical protein